MPVLKVFFFAIQNKYSEYIDAGPCVNYVEFPIRENIEALLLVDTDSR